MITLQKHIKLLLSDTQKKQLLELDNRYGDLIDLCNKSRNLKIITNIDEECDRFEKSYKVGIPYVPTLEYEHKITIKENKVIEKLNQLKYDFMHFDCFLSKYYVQLINEQLQLMQHTVDVLDGKKSLLLLQKDTIENYQSALDILKNNPYEDSSDVKNIDGKKASKEIQDYIDDCEFDWKVILDKNMLPRMAVCPDKYFMVNPERKFSDLDMEGLKAHEVDGHVARRFYGMKTGLKLFQYGLPGRMILDEGLAIWNSLNKVDKPKPNILFNIAIKSALVYNINDLDFTELVKFAQKIAPNYPLRKIFKNVVRIKKDAINMNDLGGRTTCGDYLKGYLLVDKMTDTERDDILKYNIGADQIKDLPDIKKFLELNKFEPLI